MHIKAFRNGTLYSVDPGDPGLRDPGDPGLRDPGDLRLRDPNWRALCFILVNIYT